MNWTRIRAIYRKDMRDALRDSRVLTALIMPLAFGLLYSFMFSDDAATQKVKVGIVSEWSDAAYGRHSKAGWADRAHDLRHDARRRPP